MHVLERVCEGRVSPSGTVTELLNQIPADHVEGMGTASLSYLGHRKDRQRRSRNLRHSPNFPHGSASSAQTCEQCCYRGGLSELTDAHVFPEMLLLDHMSKCKADDASHDT